MTDNVLKISNNSIHCVCDLAVLGSGLGATCRTTRLSAEFEILEKIEACTARIRATQARIDARKAVGLDAGDDEKWLATELDFLSILVDVLKGLKRSNGSD